MARTHPTFKFWLETDEGYVFGPGVYSLLRRIDERGSLKEASASLDMSYRFAWGLVRKAEERLGEPLILAHKGGRAGGGGAEITELARRFIAEFEALRGRIEAMSGEREAGAGAVKESRVVNGKTEVTISLDSAGSLKKGDHVRVYATLGF